VRARFVAETAREHGISIGIVAGFGIPAPPSVFVWAPGALSPKHQRDCEQSFQDAIYENLGAIRHIATKRGSA
jgi:hypothetical protein